MCLVLLPVGEILADGMGRAYGFALSNDMVDEQPPPTIPDSEFPSQEEAMEVVQPASPEPNGILTPTVYICSALVVVLPKQSIPLPILGSQGSKINFLNVEMGPPYKSLLKAQLERKCHMKKRT